VSKKVDKRAVGRNRIKRIARDVFRRERHQLPPGDYVLIAQPGSAALDNAALREQWLQLLARARSLKPTPPAGTMPDSPDARERPATDS
jgi:ribonuclease P protein component